MNRITRLQTMDAHLEAGLMATGDERTQRQMLEAIIRNAHFAGIPVIEYLTSKLATGTNPMVSTHLPAISPISSVPDLPDYSCETCGQKFATKHGLCGHQKKHSRSNAGAVIPPYSTSNLL